MKRSEIPRDSGAVVGCYSVHLYCTHQSHESGRMWFDGISRYGEYTGPTERIALRAARASGWWVGPRAPGSVLRAVLCPYHAEEVPR